MLDEDEIQGEEDGVPGMDGDVKVIWRLGIKKSNEIGVAGCKFDRIIEISILNL